MEKIVDIGIKTVHTHDLIWHSAILKCCSVWYDTLLISG